MSVPLRKQMMSGFTGGLTSGKILIGTDLNGDFSNAFFYTGHYTQRFFRSFSSFGIVAGNIVLQQMKHYHQKRCIGLKMLITIVCLLFVLKPLRASDQTEKLAAIYRLKDDTAKVHKLIVQCNQLLSVSPVQGKKVANDIVAISDKIAYKKGKADGYELLAMGYEFEGQYREAMQLNFKSLELREQTGEPAAIARSLCNIGLIFEALSDYPNAFSYLNRSLKEGIKARDLKIMATALSNLGLFYHNQGKYGLAMEFYLRSIELKLKTGNKKGAAVTYGNLGGVYASLSEYDKAMDYQLLSLKLREETNDRYGIGICLSELGTLNFHIKNYPKALEYMQSALQIKEELGDKSGKANVLGNLGLVYEALGNLEKALECQHKCLKIRFETGELGGQAVAFANLGNIYNAKKMYDMAASFWTRCLEIDTKIGNDNGVVDDYISLAGIFLKSGDKQKSRKMIENAHIAIKKSPNLHQERDLAQLEAEFAELENNPATSLTAFKKFIALRDCVENDDKKRAVYLKELKFRFDRKFLADSLKNKELQELKDTKIKFQQAQLQKEKMQRLALYGGLLLLAIFGRIMYVRYRITARQKKVIAFQKKKSDEQQVKISQQLEIVDRQKVTIENKQKEILDSIGYARRIQLTLLANESLLNRHLPPFFILFKPKDIISGDFYWATRKDHLFYLAVCDSTGHGVPGAFMSLLNISFLNEAINEKSITDPSQVFEYVRLRLIESVSADGARDGMDGVLLCFDRNKQSIVYSASYICPLVLRNGETFELSCDKVPVGLGYRQNAFHLFEFQPQDGDIIYLFTDGYADQFGGSRGKKLKYRAFVEKLKAYGDKPLREQKESLAAFFDEWKGENEQVDDVCVIGIQWTSGWGQALEAL